VNWEHIFDTPLEGANRMQLQAYEGYVENGQFGIK